MVGCWGSAVCWAYGAKEDELVMGGGRGRFGNASWRMGRRGYIGGMGGAVVEWNRRDINEFSSRDYQQRADYFDYRENTFLYFEFTVVGITFARYYLFCLICTSSINLRIIISINMSSSSVAVAGGTGGLGRAIVEALKADGRYQVIVLARSVNAEFEKDVGVKTHAVDYKDVTSLTNVFEENKVDTLISTIAFGPDNSGEMNMVEAAEKSKVTRRLIPNLWSLIPFTQKHAAMPIAGGMLNVISRLEKSDIEWAAVRPGLFLDYFVEGLPSYVTLNSMIVDVRWNTASIPATGETSIPLTYTHDIGKYVAALLNLQKWEHYYCIQGDKKTFNQIVAEAEKAKGVKFDVKYDSVERLKKGEVSEMPAYTEMAKHFGGGEQGLAAVKMILAAYGLSIEDGDVEYKSPLLNEMFPEIKALSVEEGWKKVAGKS
ncbi:unnamed protein product [Periconia digitata]|uniref:NmrA-like domain-containing protein n=1 Tax=Periconia digitata TaxID=1303443 RepID=A0A9W4U8D3_9PLEO|nr:unnamed protein product [Periconia digitata]